MSNQQRLEEQALSQMAEIGVASQLDEAEAIAVDVQTDLGKAIQGQVDAVSVAGKGLVFQKDIRVEQIDIQTDDLEINPLSALLGKIKLNHPINTSTRLVMTEADLNHAMNSSYVREKLVPIELNVEGQRVMVQLQPPISLQLLAESRIQFKAGLRLQAGEQVQQSQFSAVLLPRTSERPVILEEFRCQPGQGLPFELAFAFFEKMRGLLHQPYLQWEEIVFRIVELQVLEGSLVMQVDAHIHQLPSPSEFE